MLQIVEGLFDPYRHLAEFEQSLDKKRFGANNIFIGTMRDFNEGDDVTAMELQHYPAMTEKQLGEIISKAESDFNCRCLIVHRVGKILPGESIVLTAAWSAHRKAAFEACRYLIEELKHRAPFWKKEDLSNGQQRWVEHNT